MASLQRETVSSPWIKRYPITKETMRIGSLFSGIGGLELGLEWAGVGHAVWQVEREPFCRSVLARHWPNARRFDDVRTVGAHNLEPVDVICGGFPCQDISYAGKGLGLSGERSGLWYEFARIVGDMGPRFVVVENVAALVTRGLPDVLGTLSDLGYDAQWRTIRASDVGAPHRRERLFIVAYTAGKRKREQANEAHTVPNSRDAREKLGGRSVPLAYANKLDGRHGRHGASGYGGERVEPQAVRGQGVAQSRLGLATHGIPGRLDRWPARPGQAQEPWEAPRTCEKADNRAVRLRALGNAVVPQVAEEIGKWLLEINDAVTNHYERNLNNSTMHSKEKP